MASFDIIEAAGYGYRTVWAERAYFLRLAFVPIAVKFACMILIFGFDLETKFVAQALVSLPYLFTEGWMLSHAVRFVLLGQRWPFRPTGDNRADESVLRDRFRGVMAGTLTYVVARFLLAGLFSVIYGTEQGLAAREVEVSFGLFTAMVLFLGFFIWGFRLLWIFIPMAVNYAPMAYLTVLRGMSSSLYLIGAWLVSLVPLLFLFRFVTSLAMPVPMALEFILTLGQVAVDTATTLIGTLAITAGLRHVIKAEAARRKR